MHCKGKKKKNTKVKSYSMSKTHKGKKAPPGKHFMKDGTLMKDSDHKHPAKKKPSSKVRSYSMSKKKSSSCSKSFRAGMNIGKNMKKKKK